MTERFVNYFDNVPFTNIHIIYTVTYHIYSVCYYDAEPLKVARESKVPDKDVSYSDTAIRSPNRYLKKRA